MIVWLMGAMKSASISYWMCWFEKFQTKHLIKVWIIDKLLVIHSTFSLFLIFLLFLLLFLTFISTQMSSHQVTRVLLILFSYMKVITAEYITICSFKHCGGELVIIAFVLEKCKILPSIQFICVNLNSRFTQLFSFIKYLLLFC